MNDTIQKQRFAVKKIITIDGQERIIIRYFEQFTEEGKIFTYKVIFIKFSCVGDLKSFRRSMADKH